jgi:formamidopyrimidine-DNA glycosylase
MLLAGGVVERLERRGKQLAVIASDGRAIVIHLGMTGQLLLAEAGGAGNTARTPADHVHVVWRFEGASGAPVRLLFRDARRFGGILAGLSEGELHERVWSRLGPDALTVRAAELRAGVAGSARAIKAALLDQETIAGVGNIYADEACFRAGVRPGRACRGLGAGEVTRLASAVRLVLRGAIAAKGSTLRDYVTPSGEPGGARVRHLVYGRGGLPCVRCGTVLRTTKVAQRTTVYCPVCQE